MQVIEVDSVREFNSQKMQKTNLVETPNLFCDVYCLEPGQSQKVHSHVGADKLYYVLEGQAHFTVGGHDQNAGPGTLVVAPAGHDHGVRNDSNGAVRLMVVMAPNPNG